MPEPVIRPAMLQQQRLLFRRRAAVTLVIALTFLFLLVYNIGSYIFLNRMGGHLEEALDNRLMTAASLTAQLIERETTDFYSSSEGALLRLMLSRIRADNQLEAAYLIDSQLQVILDSRLNLESTVSRAYLSSDSTSIRSALSGTMSTSALHDVAGDHFKNVYAPASDLYGNTAILVLEANADFLSVMKSFQSVLLIGVAISLFLWLMLTVFLIWATLLFLRTETKLFHAQRLAALGQMAATVAHEIRNPLGVIKSTSDVLREKYAKSDELFDYINDEINRLNRLVNDFLSFSREPELKLEDHDLNDLLEHAITTFNKDGPVVHLLAEDSGIRIKCDADMIQQVMVNLLLNAVQSFPPKKGKVLVRCRVVKIKSKSVARVEVADNGPGLGGRGNQVFEPFFTTKSSGIGLGLAVSRRIVERHGGTIEAEDGAEGGTIIRFHLPVIKR